MEESLIREVLQKLRVASGLRGERKSLDTRWRVGFFYDRHFYEKEGSFVLKLSMDNLTKTIPLTEDQVETRGRSHWMSGNTWRLTPESVNKYAANIAAAISGYERKAKSATENPTNDISRLKSELTGALADLRFWTRQSHLLSSDERKQRMWAERRVAELEKALEKALASRR